ncbi:MAG TPA: deaminase [Candidatus Nanoarchaeia archaeon]|nr:deaminase [Candidatus Nanoarchaeia archaeon]
MIIGVTSLLAAGKDTLASLLEKRNFTHVSLSDFLREELKLRNKEPTRDNLISLGNELRKEFGPSILAQRALANIQEGENYVFTSIRNLAEVELLQQREDFILVNIIAPLNVRFQRLRQRGRVGDPQTIAELKAKEQEESSSEIHKQQLSAVAKKAKVTISNEKTVEILDKKIEQFLNDWIYKLQPSRPNWEIYFMNIAEQVKLRSTCMSAKKGAIIVKDKMIISTGYNGSPKGIKHCTEGGCQRCTSRHLGRIKSGEYSEPCICCHSEENAITQAAYNGTATKGGVMYTTFTPCTMCAKMIINAGIVKVVAQNNYPDKVSGELFREAGVEFVILK